MRKHRLCALVRTAVLVLLLLVLMMSVAVYSYAGETLTLAQAIDIALVNNPGLRAADEQVRFADAGVLKASSGFLPKVNLSETLSRTDNPLMVLGAKLNQELIAQSDFSPDTINHPGPMTNYNTRLSLTQPVFNGGKEYLGRKQAKLAQEASVQDRIRSRQETTFNFSSTVQIG